MNISTSANNGQAKGAFGYIMDLLQILMQDWDLSEPVSGDSLLFTHLGLQSLDAVVLSVKIQEHYGLAMPFARLFAELGRTQTDLSVRDLANFVDEHLRLNQGKQGADVEIYQ